jgi:hypothetical protein
MADVAQSTRCYWTDCRGWPLGGGQACIAHVDEEKRREIFETLKAGSPLDFARGVCFNEGLIRDLLNSAPESGGSRLLHFADFKDAKFITDPGFRSITFDGGASFDGAIFEKPASFNDVTFKAQVSFDGAIFREPAEFRDATFNARTRFRGSQFRDRATFRRSIFVGRATFKGATFNGNLVLNDVTFERRPRIDDVTCTKVVELNRAFFVNGMEILELRGRPDIVIEGTVLGSSSILSGPREQSAQPRLLSLRRSDVGKLLIADVDLHACRFVDTHNLDQLRLERGCEFARPPGRWRSQRAVIAEEHQLRAQEGIASPKRSSLTKTNIRIPFQRLWRSGWYPDVCRPPKWFLSDNLVRYSKPLTGAYLGHSAASRGISRHAACGN